MSNGSMVEVGIDKGRIAGMGVHNCLIN